MNLESLIHIAKAAGASDLHIEAGQPAILRVRGELERCGRVISEGETITLARSLLGEENWQHFLVRKSYDMSTTIAGIRCRFNVLKTARGVGLAVRLLAAFRATVERLNLHPDLKQFSDLNHGLVLLSGPTGCGKSTTIAALIQEVNMRHSKHIITVEAPVEHNFRSQAALIRQREVGRDTPSFEQALVDALREDPDVIVVGEMRETEVMRLTLGAAETGHLVFSTVHSASVGEALHRMVGAFPAEAHAGIQAQLAECLAGIVCQRLVYRPDLQLRIPECEILRMNSAARTHIRTGRFSRLADVLQTGAAEGMWSFARYRGWLESRSDWYVPTNDSSESDIGGDEPGTLLQEPNLPKVSRKVSHPKDRSLQASAQALGRRVSVGQEPIAKAISDIDDDHDSSVIEIDADDDLDSLVDQLSGKSRLRNEARS